MYPSRKAIPTVLFIALFGLGLLFPWFSCAAHPLLKEIIISYNQIVYGESLQDGTYRGEEGLLRIGPEAARSLGLTALLDDDYLDAKDSLVKAEKFFEKARSAMLSQKKEKMVNEHAQQVLDSFLSYRKALDSGRKKMMVYRSKLNPQIDERLNDSITSPLMVKLLTDSLRKNGNRLRDGLATFFNESHGIMTGDYPLNPENVAFVNGVFRQFQFRATVEILGLFDLDRVNGGERLRRGSWKQALEKSDLTFLDTVCEVLARIPACPVDPLLFLALMKRESAFDPFAVSRLGAAGLTQIMPQTALDLGMKKIFKPGYLDKAFQLQEQERRKRTEAMVALGRITPEDGLQTAVQARELMQESLAYAQEKERFFLQYRNDLLKKRDDDRFRPFQAIEHGIRYFSQLLKEQEGDISLALAAYNAGPHRVREYGGIPPYSETVLFRNKVTEYYRDYLKKVEKIAAPEG